jgi:hypothetical protein
VKAIWKLILVLMVLGAAALTLGALTIVGAHAFRVAIPVTLASLTVVAGPVLLVVVACAVLAFAMMVARGLEAAFAQDTRDLPDEDVRVMQEIHHGLLRLEQRVDNLETLMTTGGKEDDGDTPGTSPGRGG